MNKLKIIFISLLLYSTNLIAADNLYEDYYGLNEVKFSEKIKAFNAADKTTVFLKNLGITFAACPVSHTIQVVFAIGDSVPILSGASKSLSHNIKESMSDFRYREPRSESFSAYFWGGPLNVILETVYQFFKDGNSAHAIENKEAIKKAFLDGYVSVQRMDELNYTSVIELKGVFKC